MKQNKLIVCIVSLLAALPLAASAYTWSTTAQYGQYSFGNGYIVNNDIWGPGAGSQTLYVDTASGSAPHFWVNSNQPYTSGVKTYPHMGKTINKSITSISSLNGHFNVSGGTGNFEWAWDCWVPSEVMVWDKWAGAVGPWGSLYQSNVYIGGVHYNVYKPGGYWSFLRVYQTTSGTDNLAALFKWLVNGGHLSNGTVGSCQFGPEITSGNATWTVNSCSVY